MTAPYKEIYMTLIVSINEQYAISKEFSGQCDLEFLDIMPYPSYKINYYWTREKIIFEDGSIKYTTPQYIYALKGSLLNRVKYCLVTLKEAILK